jgi:hypothetical protein
MDCRRDIALLLIGFVYSTFLSVHRPDTMGLLVAGWLMGAVLMFLIWRLTDLQKQSCKRRLAHGVEACARCSRLFLPKGTLMSCTIFEETKKLFGFIPSTKRALVIIQAKVLVGYDFEKCVWETMK